MILVFSIDLCFADYLVTNRKISLKQQPSSESDPLLQVEENAYLLLMDNGHQINGYYRVRSVLFSGDGWIYRTFVRRYSGTFDGAPVADEEDDHAEGKVEVRIVDVGAGLCSLIRLPDNRYIVYDAGVRRNLGIDQIDDFIPLNSTIELMVLSHTDADHIGNAWAILQNYNVKKVLWPGYERSMTSSEDPTEVYRLLQAELLHHPSIQNINLHERDSMIVPGIQEKYGNVTLTFLCGFGEPLTSWGLTDKAEKINSVSIVMKIEYRDNSILFCGDAVGRHSDDANPNALIATEKYLVDNASQFLNSTVLIAPHHGANNGSSTAFINQVSPSKVIFSAGHKFSHPRRDAVLRYLSHVDENDIYRTDRGDDESKPGEADKEWSYTRNPGCSDEYGDDDISIELLADRTFRIYYRNDNTACE